MEYNIGQAVTDYLRENKIRQVMLAQMLNYDPGNLSRLLRKNSMSLDMIVKISVALKYNFLREVSCKLTEEISKAEHDS
ncbi:MAG: hypothetical protein MJ000_02095 [Bacteroidales bacterium]|nr:hypothetical protein [Bacteroidales bacterium]